MSLSISLNIQQHFKIPSSKLSKQQKTLVHNDSLHEIVIAAIRIGFRYVFSFFYRSLEIRKKIDESGHINGDSNVLLVPLIGPIEL